jgi:hypothetical protein
MRATQETQNQRPIISQQSSWLEYLAVYQETDGQRGLLLVKKFDAPEPINASLSGAI